MEGHTTGILKARERENTDQGGKEVDNIIHQTSQGRKDLGEARSRTIRPSLDHSSGIVSHHKSNDNNNKNYSNRNNEHHDYLGKLKSLQHKK